MRIDAAIFTKTKKEQIEEAYTSVHEMLLEELLEAICIEDIRDDLHYELTNYIQQYNLNDIDPDDVLPLFWKEYRLTSCN